MCLYPTLSINPVLKHLPLSSLPYYIDGHIVSSDNDGDSIFDVARRLKRMILLQDNDDYVDYKNSINQTISNAELLKNEVSRYKFLIDGVYYPAFVLYKCGNCIECRKSYESDVVNRSLIEAANSQYVLFYTLTYSDDNVPKFGLEQKHVRDAFKRFRIHVKRYLDIDLDFTQFYVGEYALDPNYSMRPHYHGIIFIRSKINFLQLKDILSLFNYKKSTYSYFYDKYHPKLKKFWPYGITDVQIARNPEATTRYVCKYICKQYFSKHNQALDILKERNHGYYNDFFVQLPKGHGLAMTYYDKYIDEAISLGYISLSFKHRTIKVGIPKLYLTYYKMCYHAPGFSPLFHCHLFYTILQDVINHPAKLLHSDYDVCDCNIILRYFDIHYSYILSRPLTKRTKLKLIRAFEFVQALSNEELIGILFLMFHQIVDSLCTNDSYKEAYQHNYNLISDLIYKDTRSPGRKILDKQLSVKDTFNYYQIHHNDTVPNIT